MRPRLFTFAAATMSVVLSAGVAFLWVRSYWRHDEVYVRPAGARYVGLHAYGGRIYVLREDSADPPPWGARSEVIDPDVPYLFDVSWGSSWAGFRHATFAGRHPWGFVGVPLYAPCLALVTPMAICFARTTRSARRAMTGRCPACGYDLRTTPNRCPECGCTSGKVAKGCAGKEDCRPNEVSRQASEAKPAT